MGFNKRAFWEYLYYNDNGEYLPVNELLKQSSTEQDYQDIRAHLEHLGGMGNKYLELEPPAEDYGHKYNINKLGRDGNNLDNLPIKAKITADGRVYYQRAYLEFDKAQESKELTDSVIKTNDFVKYTFIVVLLGTLMQLMGLGWTIYSDYKQQVEHQEEKKIEQSTKPQEVRIYLNDSLQKPAKK